MKRQGEEKEEWRERRGRRRGWQRSTGGEAKSMHRGGMQRAPIRGATSESTFYRTLQRIALSLSLSLVYYTRICVNVFRPASNLSRCEVIVRDAPVDHALIVDTHFQVRKCVFSRNTVDLCNNANVYMIITTKFTNLIVSDWVIKVFYVCRSHASAFVYLSILVAFITICIRIP